MESGRNYANDGEYYIPDDALGLELSREVDIIFTCSDIAASMEQISPVKFIETKVKLTDKKEKILGATFGITLLLFAAYLDNRLIQDMINSIRNLH